MNFNWRVLFLFKNIKTFIWQELIWIFFEVNDFLELKIEIFEIIWHWVNVFKYKLKKSLKFQNSYFYQTAAYKIKKNFHPFNKSHNSTYLNSTKIIFITYKDMTCVKLFQKFLFSIPKFFCQDTNAFDNWFPCIQSDICTCSRPNYCWCMCRHFDIGWGWECTARLKLF